MGSGEYPSKRSPNHFHSCELFVIVISQQNVLLPEMAAVLVISIQFPSFVEHSEHEFHCFVHYDVESIDGTFDVLQLHCGAIRVMPTLMFDTDFHPTFAAEKSKILQTNYN